MDNCAYASNQQITQYRLIAVCRADHAFYVISLASAIQGFSVHDE